MTDAAPQIAPRREHQRIGDPPVTMSAPTASSLQEQAS